MSVCAAVQSGGGNGKWREQGNQWPPLTGGPGARAWSRFAWAHLFHHATGAAIVPGTASDCVRRPQRRKRPAGWLDTREERRGQPPTRRKGGILLLLLHIITTQSSATIATSTEIVSTEVHKMLSHHFIHSIKS